MSSVRFELEKHKLQNKIRQHEHGLLGGIGSFLRGATASTNADSSSLSDSLSQGLKASADAFLESPDKIETIVKAASLLKNPRSTSLGTIVLGSIIGGVLASRLYYRQKDAVPSTEKVEAEQA